VPLNVEELPAEAVLTVALFDFENELAITPGQDVGELKIQKDGRVRVLRQPIDPKSVPLSPDAAKDYLEHFLLFPISVPVNAAIHRLRCNIYCAQVLVQSHVVSANVKATPDPIPEACTKKLDYVLSENLRARHLVAMTEEPHLLSLMINDNGDGSHSFRFFGDDGSERFKDNAQIDGPEISGFLNEARQAMHKVSWGNVDPWDPAKPLAYRYQAGAFDRKKLARDLAFLARAGWAIFDGFASHLHTTIEDLQTLMATPGLVQIALKLSPRVVVPAAIIYDYNWAPDTYDFSTTEFQLCPTFSAAIDQARNGGPALEECDCFKGKCALKEMIAEITQDPDKTLADLPPMVCPSGFWGYRHSMGLPLTLDGTNKEVPPVIEFKNDLQMVAGVSTDPQFVLRDPHLTRLKALKSVLQFERNESYKAIVKRLKSAAPHLIYFYCHGGIRANNKRPYLEIGVDDRFGPESLSAEKIKWSEPHPLVFINGCHTTSLNPEISLHFVSSFVQQSGAAGVIGTEITIFEPLAAQFAEQCLSRFLGASPHTESMPIGKAVRGARLEILKQGNPLGLVYIPYAVATLRLQQAQQN
jgi:CHAT domain-containing protein